MVKSLAELVASERARQGLSYRQVADGSGGLLSHSTVHAIESGQRESFDDDTLDGLAKSLGLPIDRVRKAAGVRRPDTDEPFALPRRAQRLSRRERQVVLDMVDALLEAKRPG
jgi:transcriptional regulator with XRE-family HTH domain